MVVWWGATSLISEHCYYTAFSYSVRVLGNQCDIVPHHIKMDQYKNVNKYSSDPDQ
jgi:hypothetical protein